MRPDAATEAAQRLHCLTSLLAQAVANEDADETVRLVAERQEAIDQMSDLGAPTSTAQAWLVAVAEEEARVLEAWDKARTKIAERLRSASSARPALAAYARNSSVRK